MKTLKQLLLLTFTILMTTAGYSQCNYEMTSKSLSDIKFKTECIENYISSYESHISIQTLDTKVFENSHGTFLLIKCKIDRKKTWVYIIKLSFVDNTVRFSDNGELNACECGNLSPDVFKFQENKIIGCKEVNHKISTKQ